VDEHGRAVKVEAAGMSPFHIAYDERGRLASLRQGEGIESRVLSVNYDAQGRLASMSDPLKRITRFEYDSAGRIKKHLLTDEREIAQTYDSGGNLKSLTPPGQAAHVFDYTPVNLAKEYQPPSAGAGMQNTRYAYNEDKKLTRIVRSDGKTIGVAYDKVGHLDTVTTPDGKLQFAFDAKSDRLKSVASADGAVSFTYDGFLLTGTRWDGAVKGSVTRKYDNDFRLASTSVNGGGGIVYKRDKDGLLIQSGDLTLERDPKNGFLTGTKLDGIATTQTYNAFGEGKKFTAAINGKEIFAVQHERDPLGRITKKIETIAGKTDTYVYDYDRAGRLSDVAKNGTKIEHYEYDANGNRLKSHSESGNASGSYDAQDRVLNYGTVAFSHSPNGEWLSKAEAGKTTTYDYDALGHLKEVALPDGTKIEYLVDGIGRRIGKKVGGKLTQGFLYMDRLRPLAELDGENNVVSRFVYATRVNVPDCLEKAGKSYRIITDAIGSVRLVIETASGAIAQRMDYDAFGNVLLDTNPGFQPFGFAGGFYDPQTKLVRFGARDYDAFTGRWTAKDPIGFRGGDTNLYAYVHNDPINHRDPLGLQITGGGIFVGGSAEGGINYGAGGQVSGGWGSIHGDYGTYGTYGGTIGGPGSSANTTGQGTDDISLGIYGGGGVGAWFTNANSWNDFQGPFDTWTLDLPAVSFSLGTSGSTWAFSFSVGPQIGAGFTHYPTYTGLGGKGPAGTQCPVPGSGDGPPPMVSTPGGGISQSGGLR
jgi:RHS repeat-associated protein